MEAVDETIVLPKQLEMSTGVESIQCENEDAGRRSYESWLHLAIPGFLRDPKFKEKGKVVIM